MHIQNFIENFANQFDDTDAGEFKSETKFKEIDEWSSLLALFIIAMTQEEYDIVLTGEDMRNSHTIQDLFDVVKSRISVNR